MKTRRTPAEIADLLRQKKILPSLIDIWEAHASDPLRLLKNYDEAVSRDKKVRGDIPRNIAIAVFIGFTVMFIGILNGMKPMPVIRLTIAVGIAAGSIIAIIGRMTFNRVKRVEKELEGFCEFISSIERAAEVSFSSDSIITMKEVAEGAQKNMPVKYAQALELKAKQYLSADFAEKFGTEKIELSACYTALSTALIGTTVTPSMIDELNSP